MAGKVTCFKASSPGDSGKTMTEGNSGGTAMEAPYIVYYLLSSQSSFLIFFSVIYIVLLTGICEITCVFISSGSFIEYQFSIPINILNFPWNWVSVNGTFANNPANFPKPRTKY